MTKKRKSSQRSKIATAASKAEPSPGLLFDEGCFRVTFHGFDEKYEDGHDPWLIAKFRSAEIGSRVALFNVSPRSLATTGPYIKALAMAVSGYVDNAEYERFDPMGEFIDALQGISLDDGMRTCACAVLGTAEIDITVRRGRDLGADGMWQRLYDFRAVVKAAPSTQSPTTVAAPSIRSEVITLTAERAAAILASGSNVRRLKPLVVNRYARDMAAGAWVECSPQGLVFDNGGVLVDGQHRLTAQVRTNRTLSWCAVFGASREQVNVLDQGAGRTAQDVLYGGSVNGSLKVQVARAITRISDLNAHKLGKTTIDAVQRMIDRIPSDGLAMVSARGGRPIAPVRAAFALALQTDPDLIAAVWESVCSGRELTERYRTPERSTTLGTLNRFLSERARSLGTQGHVHVFRAASGAIRALLKNQPLTFLRTTNESAAESFLQNLAPEDS